MHSFVRCESCVCAGVRCVRVATRAFVCTRGASVRACAQRVACVRVRACERSLVEQFRNCVFSTCVGLQNAYVHRRTQKCGTENSSAPRAHPRRQRRRTQRCLPGTQGVPTERRRLDASEGSSAEQARHKREQEGLMASLAERFFQSSKRWRAGSTGISAITETNGIDG
eukprot:6151644-Pleurochrysis_carterae.AAC.2